ncbi:MAG: hypothetical protein HC848_03950 [Limnobacter sp.]|nr:hypothetical protein [Limnobacter sp.]
MRNDHPGYKSPTKDKPLTEGTCMTHAPRKVFELQASVASGQP